jgi:hypothetical protein
MTLHFLSDPIMHRFTISIHHHHEGHEIVASVLLEGRRRRDRSLRHFTSLVQTHLFLVYINPVVFGEAERVAERGRPEGNDQLGYSWTGE